MNLRQRHNGPELLDGDGIPAADLYENLRELEVVNRLLGGHATTRAGLVAFLELPRDMPIHIAEIGCGGGDNLAVLHRWLQSRGIPHRFTGIDMKEDCIRYAKARMPATAEVTWACSDYRLSSWEGNKPDVIFSSLFCHHFSDLQLTEQLQWLRDNTSAGFFINDLRRNAFAYEAIRFFTKAFSKSYLVKNDAPLSVMRGFRDAEWAELFRQAGMPAPAVACRWAFRHLIIWKHEGV